MKQKNFLLLFLMFILLLSSITFGQQQSLGIFEKDSCIEIKQTCANCTYVTFSSITYPNSSIAGSGLVTVKTGTEFAYSNFCNTTVVGQYIVNGVGDVDGLDTIFAFDFEVNPSGRATNLGVGMAMGLVFIIILLVSFGSFMIYYAEGPLKFVSLLATMLLVVFGLNLVANLSFDFNMSARVTSLLWMIYRMFLYGFFAMFFFVLAKLTSLLRIQKNPPPRIDSPLKQVRANRRAKYGKS